MDSINKDTDDGNNNNFGPGWSPSPNTNPKTLTTLSLTDPHGAYK